MSSNPLILHEQFNDQVFSGLYNGDEISVRQRSLMFDWQQRNDTWGTPLLAILSGNLWEAPDWMFHRKVALTRWAMSLGARPDHHAPLKCEWWIEFPWEDLVLGGTSAVSLVSNALHLGAENDYPHNSLAMHRLRVFREVLAAATFAPTMHRVDVRASVPQLWEMILKDTNSSDFEFVTSSGSVLAHVAVLQEACPKLPAIKSRSSHGDIVREEVPYSWAAMKHFTSLLYCGCFAEGLQIYEGDCSTLVELADAAICFSAQALIPMLAMHLRCQLQQASFGPICSFALRHGHDSLLEDCRYFARRFYHEDMGSQSWDAFHQSLPSSVQ
ncbi:HERC2, partial [Symbiodinium microadriaticum]